MKVSICCSVLNQSEFLQGMIASVIGQSFKDWELIIVDDGSTEDIKMVCQNWNDERIKYVRFRENRGVPHGINHAFSIATGEYIQPLSADERLDFNKLLWQVGYLDDNPAIGGLWGLPQNGPVGERPEWEQYALKAHNRSKEAWVRTLLNLENIPIGGASWLVRRAVLEEIGLFDPQFYTCSDLELFVRFFKKHEGRVFPYRWAYEEPNPNAIRKTITPESFQEDIGKVRKKHELVFPVSKGRVTVAIPVRNMAQYIPETILSLKAQTYQDFDIVIFDDASEDDTVEVVKKLADTRTKLIQSTDNVGPNAAQNHMLAQCETPFFVVLAADDTVEPTFLERCIAQFSADPWLEFVASQTDFIRADGTPLIEDHPLKQIQRAANKPKEEWLRQLYYGNQYFGAGMYRTKVAQDLGGWDATVGVLGDYDMYLKLLQRENIFVIEENLTHTRVHDKQRSVNLDPAKNRQWSLDLRNHYHTIKTRYYPPRMKVIIATPFYNMNGFSPYIVSLLGCYDLLNRFGIEHEFWELSGDSYVDRAKNTLFNKFLEDPAATDMFMIDSDMQWNAAAMLNILQLPEEIVMGSYPQKNSWETFTARPLLREENGHMHPVGRMLPDGSALIQAEYLAGGFIRIRRSALEKYRDHYKDLVYHDAGADPSAPERLYTEFFCCERGPLSEGGPILRWGEDRVFGKRMAAIGINGWIYPKIDFGHYGIKGWMGNYDTHLRTGAKAA